MITLTIRQTDRSYPNHITFRLLAAVFLTILCASWKSSADELVAKAATVRMVAVKELHEYMELLATLTVPDLEDRFVQTILEDTNAHQEPADSKKLLRNFHRQILRQKLDAEVQRIAQYYNQDLEDPHFSAEWLDDLLSTRMTSAVTSAIAGNVQAHFAATFGPARIRAVQTQRARVSTTFYPDISTVAELDRKGWSAASVQNVIAETATRIEAIIDEPLLLEVQREVADLSRNALIDAQEQARIQHEVVATKEPPTEFIAAEQLSSTLRRFVEDFIAPQERNKQPGQVIYPLLPTVNEVIEDRARELERLRFLRFAEQYPWSIEPESLRAEITRNLVLHKRKAKSLEVVISTSLTEFLDEVLGRHVGGIENPETEETCLRRLHDALQTKSELNDAARDILGEKLQNSLSLIRSKIVGEQLADFAELNDGAWQLHESLVLKLVSTSSSAQPDRSQSTLKDQLQSVGFELRRGIDISSLLEESEQRLMHRCQQLLAEARNAFDGQNRAVMRQEEAIAHDIQTSGSDRTMEEWVDHFAGIVQQEWSREVSTQRRESTTASANSGTYIALFDSVRTRIRQIIKAQYELGQDTRLSEAQPKVMRIKEPETLVTRSKTKPESNKRGEPSSATQAPREFPKLSFEPERGAIGAGHEANQGTGTRPDLEKGSTGRDENAEAGSGPPHSTGPGIPWWLILVLLLLVLLLVFLALRHFARLSGSSGRGDGVADQPIQLATWSIMISRPVKDLRAGTTFYLSFEGARLVTNSAREAIVEIGSTYVRLLHVPNAPSNPPLELSVFVPNVDDALKQFSHATGRTSMNDLRDPDGLFIGVRPRSEISGSIEGFHLADRGTTPQPRQVT